MNDRDERLSEEMEGNLIEDKWFSPVNSLCPSLDDLFPEIHDNWPFAIDDEIKSLSTFSQTSFLDNLNKLGIDCNEVKLEVKLCQWTSHRKTLVTDTNGTFLFMKAS